MLGRSWGIGTALFRPLGLGMAPNRGICRTTSPNSAKKPVENEGGSLPDKSSLPNEAVFYHPQHNMYVCWHPEVPFPYEMSKPIPAEAELTQTSLKVQALEPVKEIFRKKNERLIIRELMKLTYTERYGWRGRHGKKLKWVRKELDPLKQFKDRDYL